MQKSPAAPGGAFRSRPPRTFRTRGPVSQQTFQLQLPSGGAHATILTGKRLPRPNIERLRWVRSVKAAASASADRPTVVRQDVWEEDALSHNTGLQLLFLGTGTGHPAELRRAGSMAVKLARSIWLFDCGEDTQRQMHRQPLIRHGKVDRIFITNCRSSNILGLPGMLCTMSAAREIGLDIADVPLHLYGPPGLAEFIKPLLQLSDTYISMPVLVHEMVDHAVPPEAMEPECLDRRSCLYRVLIPPDALNPQGFYDGTITLFLDRARSKTKVLARGQDERVNSRDLPLPPPGNPDAQLADTSGLRWTIKCDRDTMLTAARVPAEIPSWAFVCQEADRVGKLDVRRCEELQLFPGSTYSALKEGRSVTNAAGRVVTPEEVVGPDIPGRKLVVVGESSDSMPLADLAQGADAVIHCASFKETGANGVSQSRHALDKVAAFSKAAHAQHLVLYRFKPVQQAAQASEDGSDGASQGSTEMQNPFDKLNPLNSYKYERRDVPGGYLCWAKGHQEPAECPAHIVSAAEAHATQLLGQPKAVSIAEDMTLFAVERRPVPEIPKRKGEGSNRKGSLPKQQEPGRQRAAVA